MRNKRRVRGGQASALLNESRGRGRVYGGMDELSPAFCPICDKPVALIISETRVEVFGVCLECGKLLFYYYKLGE